MRTTELVTDAFEEFVTACRPSGRMSSGVERMGDVEFDIELNPFKIGLDSVKVLPSRPGDVPLPRTIPPLEVSVLHFFIQTTMYFKHVMMAISHGDENYILQHSMY